MSATPSEKESKVDFLLDDAEWDAWVESCRERWSQTIVPLRQMEVEFQDFQRELLQEDQPSEEAWDRLLDDYGQSSAKENGLRPYIETGTVATTLFNSPAGSLGWREPAAIRLKFDQSLTALLDEPVTSTELREALLGVAVKVASRPDFYRPVKVARDKQRSRLGMDDRVPHYYSEIEALPGSEQPKGAEPRLVRKLRLLAEWRLRRQCYVWEIWKERRIFWTDAQAEMSEFLRELFPVPVTIVRDFAPGPVLPFVMQDRRSGWDKFKDWLWNVTIGLLFPRWRRHRTQEEFPPPELAPALPPTKPETPLPRTKLSKVPLDREHWPVLCDQYKQCEKDAGLLDEAGRVQDEQTRRLADTMARIVAGEQDSERGIDVAHLRADSTTRDLTKEVELRHTRSEGLAESIFKLP